MNRELAGVVAAMAIAGGAMAQDAVQWRIEDGGNGHWYQGVVVSQSGASWSSARAYILAHGGDLAIIPSRSSAVWIFSFVVNNPTLWMGSAGPWVGGFQQPRSTEPMGGWAWVDGTPIQSDLWSLGQPDNALACGGDNNCMAYWNAYEGGPRPYLEDSPDIAVTPCGIGNRTSAIAEYSADCNSDGIVDFGQIRDGSLADANANNIPDCCEAGQSCAPCPADIVQDNAVNGVDLAAVINAWGTDGGKLPRSDVDGNGIVDGADLAQVLGSWGPCP